MFLYKRRSVIQTFFGRRFAARVLIVAALAAVLLLLRSLSVSCMVALSPPPPLVHDLHHLRRSRSLKQYMDQMSEQIIEPSSVPCDAEIPLVALVASAPHRFGERAAIRETWGRHQPTYFFVGLPDGEIDEQLVDNYVEAKEHGDLVVGDFTDSYHNLTLKTALMLKWALTRCPRARFVLKTDDDVMVNPWAMEMVLRRHSGADLVGYKKENSAPHRDGHSKWYLPRWLYSWDTIPEYLSGTAYLISGTYLRQIYERALTVPLINLEDVFFTYLVASQSLGLRLSHEPRLSPYRPLLPAACAHWNLAAMHSVPEHDMHDIWTKIRTLADHTENGDSVCQFYVKYMNSELLLYSTY